MKFLRFVDVNSLLMGAIYYPRKNFVLLASRTLRTNRKFSTKFLSQKEAIDFDKELFNEYKFSIDQLMELAGLSVAMAICKTGQLDSVYKAPAKVLVVCGPGNNGGDGLVAARHLKLFGYDPVILYPKPNKSELFTNLVTQCKLMDIEFLDHTGQKTLNMGKYRLVLDSVFGFSYHPPLRSGYHEILQQMSLIDSKREQRLISVDIPSGWHVEQGPPLSYDNSSDPILLPDSLISLSAPKLCAQHFQGKFHWLGGRFVPPSLQQKYHLTLPEYPMADQCVLITPETMKNN